MQFCCGIDKQIISLFYIIRIELQQLEEVESRQREISDKKEAAIANAILHAESFVEYLNSDHLFESLFENDTEGNALMVIGDEIKEYYDDYREQFLGVCQQIFTYGQEQYTIRKTEVNQFFETVNKAKQSSQLESIVSTFFLFIEYFYRQTLFYINNLTIA